MSVVSKTMFISFFTNLFLSIFKVIAGVIGECGALIADGIHSFSDLSTDLVAMIGHKLSRKPADESHPYGHGKIEYMTSIIISVVILILGITVIIHAVTKEIQIPSILVAVVSFLTIFIKYFLSSYIIRVGKKEKNSILLASGYESRTDVFSSVVVFISILFMQMAKKIPIFQYADVVAMLLVGLLILKIGFELLKENVSSILDEQERDETYLNQIKEILLESSEIRRVDNLKVLKFGTYYKIDVEVSMDPNMSLLKSHRHTHEAENRLRIFDDRIWYIHIHVNPDESYSLRRASKKDLEKIEEYRLNSILDDSLSKEEKERKENFVRKETQKHLEDYQMILHDKDVIGTVGYYMVENKLYVEEIYIEERFRYCGIGTRILKDIMKQHSNVLIYLWVRNENKFAISFYKKLGFKEEVVEESRIKMCLNEENA